MIIIVNNKFKKKKRNKSNFNNNNRYHKIFKSNRRIKILKINNKKTI